MAISSVSGVSIAPAVPHSPARPGQASSRAADGAATPGKDSASQTAVPGVSPASAAIDAISKNASAALLSGSSSLSFNATLAVSARAPAPNALATIESRTRAADGAGSAAGSAATAAGSTAPTATVTGATDTAALNAETAALSLEAQADLVQRRIAQDIATAFKTIAVDQTYSAAATAMYLSAAVYRLQVDRPKDAMLVPGPVQPVASVDSIAALGDFGVGDSTAHTR